MSHPSFRSDEWAVALTDGGDVLGDSGRVVESVHHVGDDRYEFSV